MSVILSEQLDYPQLATLLNKADLEECEGWSWARLKARTTINSFPATTFTINVTQNATAVVSTSGPFPIIPTNQFVLRISGQNYSPMNVVSNNTSSSTLQLAVPYPGPNATGATGILFQLYYSVPGWQDITGVQQQVDLRYMTEDELYRLDPWLSEVASPALRYIPCGRGQTGTISTDDPQFILWPIETGTNGYVVRGLRGHVDMVNPTDVPSVPSAVIVAKALAEGCESLFTLRGDPQWDSMRNYYRQIYNDELDKARERDRLQYGVIRQVQDGRPTVPGLDQIPFRDSSEWD